MEPTQPQVPPATKRAAVIFLDGTEGVEVPIPEVFSENEADHQVCSLIPGLTVCASWQVNLAHLISDLR